MRELFIISGAQGSGKNSISTIINKKIAKDYIIYNFDEYEQFFTFSSGKNISLQNTEHRQELTEKWLQKIISEDKPVCLFGEIVLGEIICCPSFSKINNIQDKFYFIFLDVKDDIRIKRLSHNNIQVSQNLINWAAWLRIHTNDPTWEQDVILTKNWHALEKINLLKLIKWPQNIHIKIIDTTLLPVIKVARIVENIILEGRWQNDVIFINGASSSGKTTLAKALQEKLPYNYLHISLDGVIAIMPDKVNTWNTTPTDQGFWWKVSHDSDGNKLAYIQIGSFARQIVSLLKSFIIFSVLYLGVLVILSMSFGHTPKNFSKYFTASPKVMFSFNCKNP